jgi:hypothetical protein
MDGLVINSRESGRITHITLFLQKGGDGGSILSCSSSVEYSGNWDCTASKIRSHDQTLFFRRNWDSGAEERRSHDPKFIFPKEFGFNRETVWFPVKFLQNPVRIHPQNKSRLGKLARHEAGESAGNSHEARRVQGQTRLACATTRSSAISVHLGVIIPCIRANSWVSAATSPLHWPSSSVVSRTSFR